MFGALLAVAIYAMGMTFSSPIAPPNAEPETGAQERPQKQASKANTDERIADYTWWLAVLTGALVLTAVGQGFFIVRSDKTARIAANAADLSARAAIAIELPVIKAEPDQFGFGSKQNADGPRIEYCIVALISFANVGRTQAYPVEVQYGWTFGNALPGIPVYTFTKRFRINEIIHPSDTGFLNLDEEFAFDQGIDPIEAVRTATSGLWFYCRLVYLDFMQNRHESSFCWRRHQVVGKGFFLVDSTPIYNRKT
ncbi:hypothetical protein UP10_12780 [Bradyrhizobium sp. LTSPM299]|nr:hypothetical protein UP10_12780 [Bradyrhizobium sp. LTSPM299]